MAHRSHSGEVSAGSAVAARGMRRANLSLVLAAILREAPVSQARLADLTGLKKATISNLVEELSRLGWVRAEGASPTKVGRPPRLLGPNPARGFLIAAQISIDRLTGLVVDFAGGARARRSSAVDVHRLSQQEAVGWVAELVLDALAEAGVAGDRVLGSALGVAGIVGDDGRLRYVPGLQWDAADVGGLLRESLAGALPAGAPLLVENEAKLAALAEQKNQAARGVDNFVFLLGEVGVGAGVILDGALFRGTRGAGGEVGHASIAVDGPPCRCGKRGCWATFVSRQTLVASAWELLAAGRRSVLGDDSETGRRRDPTSGRDPTAERLSPERIVAAARDGDAVAVEALGALRRHLAAGIGNVASAYDPEVVLLGGFLAAAFRDDLDALQSEVEQWLMGDLYDGLRVELPVHGDDAPLWGGVSLVHQALVADPRRVPVPPTDQSSKVPSRPRPVS